MKKQLDHAKETIRPLTPEQTPLACDMTFWGRGYGVCVFRSPTLKKNLWWAESLFETPGIYEEGLLKILRGGWKISGVVLDGKRGIAGVFRKHGIPVQYCQFHQMKTVTKYLTRRPKTQAGWELRAITLSLARTTEEIFQAELLAWRSRWDEFLSEKTPCSCCKERFWPYTHRKLRAAFRSLKTNLSFLFTCQRYPELNLPNTTNCLDGMFSQIKNRLAVHRGLRRDRRYRLIDEILKNSN